MQYLSFCAWLISFNIMSCGFVHVVANDRIFYLVFRIYKKKQKKVDFFFFGQLRLSVFYFTRGHFMCF
jgi:hypothetical protein